MICLKKHFTKGTLLDKATKKNKEKTKAKNRSRNRMAKKSRITNGKRKNRKV